ncbi:SRPBCC family protein [Sphingorhabdus sp.]|uniref:SRPBCC family protein n=1 Tax=Sphingorhabdus sp. TaxID=1902408 RepID=UPI00391B48B6
MSEDDNTQHDDAPSTTSKHGKSGDLERFSRAMTISREPTELYRYWRDFSNLPTIMDNIVSVTPVNDEISDWVAIGPGDSEVKWRARVTEDIEGAFIAWKSDEDADVFNEGRISFSPAQGNRGTVVTATMSYDPPAGFVGRIVAKVLQREPEVQLRRDLRRFKQLMETGEIATNVRNPAQLAKEGK